MLRLADHYPNLCKAWPHVFGPGTPPPLSWFEDHYNEPHRAYHNQNHIVRLLNLHQERQFIFASQNPDIPGAILACAQVAVAIWFHDVVYEAGNPDNEAASALCVLKQPCDEDFSTRRDEVIHMIEASRHNADRSEASPALRYFLDLDLEGLSDPPELFVRTTEKIRAEFGKFSEEEWRKGRLAFWHRLLAQPRIYYNPFGVSLYVDAEQQARLNIAAEMQRLSQE